MDDQELIKIAKSVRKNAFLKHTDYSVGAALLTGSNKVYYGVNIDDYAIPALSICAERVAINNAIANSERVFKKIAVVGGKVNRQEDDTLIPCGMCLQYILDIAPDVDIIVYIDGKLTAKKVKEFLKFPYQYNGKENSN